MKKINILVLILALNLFLSSCGKSNEVKEVTSDSKPTESAELEYKKINFSKSNEGCDTASGKACATYSANWIEYTSGNIKDKLNSFINTYLLDSAYSLETPVKYPNVEAIADSFIANFNSFKTEIDYEIGWSWEMDISEQYRSSKVVVLNMTTAGFTGGAHGFQTVNFYNLSRENGNRLELSDILKPGFEDELNKLVDAQYRKDKGLSPTANLATEGDLFENEIKFNNNFAITKDGILFFYNQYEIAAYAYGQTEVLIRYDQLGDWLDDKSIMN